MKFTMQADDYEAWVFGNANVWYFLDFLFAYGSIYQGHK